MCSICFTGLGVKIKIIKWLIWGVVGLVGVVWLLNIWQGKSELDKLAAQFWIGLGVACWVIIAELKQIEERSKARDFQIMQLLQSQSPQHQHWHDHDD